MITCHQYLGIFPPVSTSVYTVCVCNFVYVYLLCNMLYLLQVLDFERESEYILVLSAQNPVALVRGRYGPASTATVSIYVDDVNECPILSQSHYEVTVREGEEPGRVIATIRGYDPDSHPIRLANQLNDVGITIYLMVISSTFTQLHMFFSADIPFRETQRNTFQ